ncbi:hypothetical protein ID856_14430 [Xenorhabdus sp. 18]|uniref:hypothetical protein n=1 Tax=Xenorhabdus doucetiae TaxID=351671 RepID=UPI0019A342DA|nr:hypothetical protein [Xenorhabdus sp. 18]MBD2797722.1 hypothetical protein [Xenorhabdus sp. 18]
MMKIRINEDGSLLVTTQRYFAHYDKEGRFIRIMGAPGEAPRRLTIIQPTPKQEAEKEQATIAADEFRVSDSAKISETKTINDDHIRHLIREELQQFVNRESQRGGLFSRW